jgi:hypothetical protein
MCVYSIIAAIDRNCIYLCLKLLEYYYPHMHGFMPNKNLKHLVRPNSRVGKN